MVQAISAQLYQCPECGLHYTDQATAQRCEAWCREHKSCNLEIIKDAVENKAQRDQKNSWPPSA